MSNAKIEVYVGYVRGSFGRSLAMDTHRIAERHLRDRSPAEVAIERTIAKLVRNGYEVEKRPAGPDGWDRYGRLRVTLGSTTLDCSISVTEVA